MGKSFKNLAEQLEYEHIQVMKRDKEKLFTFNNNNKTCNLKILNRGEQLFYQEDERAFICEISVMDDVVFSGSIKKWDSGEKITVQEKEQIKQSIEKFFMDNYQTLIWFQ